jgi:hypothetical protein
MLLACVLMLKFFEKLEGECMLVVRLCEEADSCGSMGSSAMGSSAMGSSAMGSSAMGSSAMGAIYTLGRCW